MFDPNEFVKTPDAGWPPGISPSDFRVTGIPVKPVGADLSRTVLGAALAAKGVKL